MLVRLSIILAFITALSIPCAAMGDSGYTLTLANGNTLSASSYTIKGDKVMLTFPLGEAEVRLSDVVSIKEDGGGELLFRDKGVYTPGQHDDNKAVSGKDKMNGGIDSASSAGTANRGAYSHPVQDLGNGERAQRRWSQAYYSPQVQEIDSFVDDMFKADEEGREVPEEDIDKAFTAFFDDGSGVNDTLK